MKVQFGVKIQKKKVKKKADSIFTPKKFRKTRTFGVIFQQSVKVHFEKF